MTPLPSKSEFITAYDKGKKQVLWTTLIADLETPVSAYLKLAENDVYSSLL